MTPNEAFNFYHALSMEYVQFGMDGRKATQMSVLEKMRHAQQALSQVIQQAEAKHTQAENTPTPDADKEAGNDADSG